MKVFLGTDHAGYEMKEAIKATLQDRGYDVEDLGAHAYDKQDDYPDIIRPVAEAVAEYPEYRGIIFGGSGQGEGIVANRVSGIRAAVYNTENLELVKVTRQHNDANILSIGSRYVSEEHAKEAILLFLETPFSNEDRHIRRIGKI